MDILLFVLGIAVISLAAVNKKSRGDFGYGTRVTLFWVGIVLAFAGTLWFGIGFGIGFQKAIDRRQAQSIAQPPTETTTNQTITYTSNEVITTTVTPRERPAQTTISSQEVARPPAPSIPSIPSIKIDGNNNTVTDFSVPGHMITTINGRTIDFQSDQNLAPRNLDVDGDRYIIKSGNEQVVITPAKILWGDNQSKTLPATWCKLEINVSASQTVFSLDGKTILRIPGNTEKTWSHLYQLLQQQNHS